MKQKERHKMYPHGHRFKPWMQQANEKVTEFGGHDSFPCSFVSVHPQITRDIVEVVRTLLLLIPLTSEKLIIVIPLLCHFTK